MVPFEQLDPKLQEYITSLVENNARLRSMHVGLVAVCIVLIASIVWLSVRSVIETNKLRAVEKEIEARRASYAAFLDMIVAGGHVDRVGLEKVITEHYSTDACLVDDVLLFSTSNSTVPNGAGWRRRRIFKDVTEKQGVAFRLIFDDERVMRVFEMMHGGFIVWRNNLPAEKLGFNPFVEE